MLGVPQQSVNNGDEFHRGKEGIDENRTLIARKHLICFPQRLWHLPKHLTPKATPEDSQI